MTNPVPQFPGKPAQTGEKQPVWKDMICPMLTAGELARQGPTSLVQLGANNAPKAVGSVACLGPKCAMYTQLMTADGKVIQQGCAAAVLVPMQLSLNQMVSKFIEAAEAGARLEAEERAREEAEEAAKNPPTPEAIKAAADELVKAAGGTLPTPEPSPLTATADKAETTTS